MSLVDNIMPQAKSADNLSAACYVSSAHGASRLLISFGMGLSTKASTAMTPIATCTLSMWNVS